MTNVRAHLLTTMRRCKCTLGFGEMEKTPQGRLLAASHCGFVSAGGRLPPLRLIRDKNALDKTVPKGKGVFLFSSAAHGIITAIDRRLRGKDR